MEPGPGAFVCSCHFKDGKRENMPTLFQHNEGKRFMFESPERKKRRNITGVEEEILETEELQER